MSKVILHIGYPKTATKWFLGNFYPEVKNAGIIYNENLYYDIHPETEFFEIRPDNRYVERELKIIATHALSGFGEGKCKIGILRPFFLKHLKQLFPDATVIIFIRNQFEFMSSLYSSYLKRGGTEKIKNFYKINKNKDGEFFSFDYLNYSKAITEYQNHFGEENVHVYLFEDFAENNFSFLNEFIQKLAISIDLSEISYKKKNEKLRVGLAFILRLTNNFFKKGLKPKKHIANLPLIYEIFNLKIDSLNKYRIWGKKLNTNKMLTSELKKFIYEYYKDSNQELIDRFGLENIKKYGYPL